MKVKNSCRFTAAIFSLSINPKFYFCGVHAAFFVFPLICAAEKHLVSEKSLNKRFFKGTGVVLAGIECSPKIFDFRANGIPVQERVEKVDTLKIAADLRQLFYIGHFYYLFLNQADGENAIIIGKISSLPKSIAKDKIYFAKSE